MSSPYAILNDRPVDQWKVTELKEELKRRKLKTNGLKEELVKRLDGALRLEMEEVQKEAESSNGSVPDSDPVDKVGEEESAPTQVETDAEPVGAKVNEVVEEKSAPPAAENSAEHVEAKVNEVVEKKLAPPPAENSAEHVEAKVGEVVEKKLAPPPAEISAEPVEDKSNQADNDTAMVDNIQSAVVDDQGVEDQDRKEVGHTTLDAALEDTTDNAFPLENSETAMVDNIQSTVVDDEGTEDEDRKEVGHTALDAALEDTTDNAFPLENSETCAVQLESSDQAARYDEKNEDSKPSSEDAALSFSDPTNQVPEVSPDLGFQVKSESISTDSVSINEKNELKDNLNANNVNLEQEVVKPEMVQPSSSDAPTIGGDSQPFEDDKEMVDSLASMEEAGDVTCAADMELCKKIEGVDGGSPEKLNLDRSSGDESMEEDVLESKQIESKNNSDVGERKEGIKYDVAELGKPIDALVGGFSPEKKDMIDSQEETKPIAAAGKRKAEDQEAVAINNEPKRQHRWNSDAAKAPEPQTANVTTSTPKDAFQPALRRSFSRSGSSLSGDAPKERIVPPSQKPATTSLRIDQFLRPFTLKALQELLGKTGTVTDFWMDQIKTHCYVTYSSVEEASATRNALYNLQWPTNGGRLLVAEFVDPQEVKMRLEAPPQSPAPVTPSPTTPTAPPFQRQPQAPAPSRPNLRQQQLPPPPPLPPPPALSNPPPARERLPPPPPPPKKPDPPIMTLDDLFKKTKATPRIYYLPLSEEQVAAKLQAEQGK